MIPSHTGFSFFLFSFFSTLLKCLWVSHSFFFDTSIHFSSYVICLLSNHSTFLCEWQPIVKPSQLCNSRTTSFTSQTIVNCHGDLSEPVKAITTKTEHMERHTVFIYMGALKCHSCTVDLWRCWSSEADLFEKQTDTDKNKVGEKRHTKMSNSNQF